MNKINLLIEEVKVKENITKIYSYYKDIDYLGILIRQLNQIESNVKSIETLLSIDNVNDAYTIYRKLLETFFIVMSVNKHPDLVNSFLMHNQYEKMKVLHENDQFISKLRKDNIDGFIEYGYIKPYIKSDATKIVLYDVAKCGGTLAFFKQYKICNNFVHNNLNLVKVIDKDAKEQLEKALENVLNHLYINISKIYK